LTSEDSLKMDWSRVDPVPNLDNGPENHSRRTQFIKRVWGRLENHWNEELLYSIDKVIGLAANIRCQRRPHGFLPMIQVLNFLSIPMQSTSANSGQSNNS